MPLDEHGAHVGVGGGALDLGGQGVVHGDVDGVLAFDAVEGEREHTGFLVNEDVGHGRDARVG